MEEDLIRKAIKKQIVMIATNGYDPSWDLFEVTFGWFQIKNRLNDEQVMMYEQIWSEEHREYEKSPMLYSYSQNKVSTPRKKVR